MIQLVRQRRQRPATRPAPHDLPHQVISQRLSQHAARNSQQLGRRPAGAGQSPVIQDSQLCGDSRLQRLQQRHLPSQHRVRRWLPEDLADHHRQLLSLLTARWGQLRCGGLNSGRGGLAQRTLLITAQHQRDQLLAAGIGEQPDQPRPKVIGDKHHPSSLPSP